MRQWVPIGVRYMVAAAFFFSLMSLLVKLAGRRLPSAEIVFARSIVTLVLAYIMLRQRRLRPWGSHHRLLVLRGVAGFFALMCFFYAVTKLPLADVTVIHFTNPVFTAILASFYLKERMGWRELTGLLVSLSGVLLVARPSFLFGSAASSLDLLAVAIALLGSIISSVAYTTVRKLGALEHHLVVVFFYSLVAAPASIPFMAAGALWPTPVELMFLVGVGLVTHVAQIYLTKGLRAERAGRAMSIGYVQIVFAAVWGAVFFNDRPSPLTVVGAVLIIFGTLLVAGRVSQPDASPTPSTASRKLP